MFCFSKEKYGGHWYFAAEASRGFQTLDEIIGQLNIPNDKVKELRANLLDGKQYLNWLQGNAIYRFYRVTLHFKNAMTKKCRNFIYIA